MQVNLFLSQTRICEVIGLVDVTSFNDSFDLNPFNCQPFGLTYLSLSVDGWDVMVKPLPMDYENIQYVRAFFGTILALVVTSKNAVNQTVCWVFNHGYFMPTVLLI